MARPQGSTNLPKIRDHYSQEEVEKIARTIYKVAIEKENPKMLAFLGEQIFGKAPQTMDITSGGEKIVPIYAGESK